MFNLCECKIKNMYIKKKKKKKKKNTLRASNKIMAYSHH